MDTEKKKTVLIVDDEPSIHKALVRTLRREPYELLHAYDAAEAAAIIEQRAEIVLVICDHYMPGTHGLDLLRDLGNRHPELVTVLLTAQADLELVMAALNEGHISRFFTKPWDPDELRESLRGALAEAAGATEATPAEKLAAQRLQEEMTLLRDTGTGAFIIDPID
jgi:DNA-binding NtrC family response regulator